MELTKAIKILVIFRDHTGFTHPVTFENAAKLGIEALTYIVRLRACSFEHRQNRLPSEISISDLAPSALRKQKLRESPLGREPRG